MKLREEWKTLGEDRMKRRSRRYVCMRDQDGGDGNGTRKRSVNETNDYDCHQTENAST